MGVINFSKANCESCYCCVRACPVHAVRVKNKQAEIIEERCIACGKCLKVCPKNAKAIQSELETVKQYLTENQKVAISLAPSFAAVFGKDADKICAALKHLGFTYVEETAVGAEKVTIEYEKYANIIDGKCYITSCCPAVNDLIQTHYPEIIPNLIPVVTPMSCHGRMMKEKYGNETKVVFIGPCLAKKIEAKEEAGIDAVLTFDELKKWFREEGIQFDKLEMLMFDASKPTMQQYPIVGGVTDTFKNGDIQKEVIHIDGVKECVEVMKCIEQGQFKDVLVEISLCRHGCIGGPAMPEDGVNVYERRQRIKKYAQNCENNINNTAEKVLKPQITMHCEFQSNYAPLKQPSAEEVQQILTKMGKYSKLDELNCGTCGYTTCKEKAIAVYNDMAELNMCLPFMKQKAETLTNVIFDMTPSIIVILNLDMEIIEFNPAAEKLFRIRRNRALGLPISLILESNVFEEIQQTKQNILGRKLTLSDQDAVVLQSVIWVENQEAILIILHDITESEKQEQQMQKMKIHAIDMAQQVIDKQMRVAQEIASLLGETTAETKVTLTKLKRLVQFGEEVEFK